MEKFIVLLGIGLIIVLLIKSSGSTSRQEVSTGDRARHRQDENSHIYYVVDNRLVHESETCSGCAQNRADELQRKGYLVDEVILGRRHSGDLTW